MEYSDEWWKPYEWIDGGIHNATQNHFGNGPLDESCPPDGVIDSAPAFPDQYMHQEWFGIVRIQGDGFNEDIVNPREVYYALQKRFACVDQGNPFYAGPENNKSCDGTSACCANPQLKSKDGECKVLCQDKECKKAKKIIKKIKKKIERWEDRGRFEKIKSWLERFFDKLKDCWRRK